jgi:hypothetical protein
MHVKCYHLIWSDLVAFVARLNDIYLSGSELELCDTVTI